MDTSHLIKLVLTILSGCVILVFLAIPILVKLHDRWAVRAARRYCEQNGLEFLEARAWPNHYGLYFRKGGKRLHASFDFERDRTITWKKGSPLEIAGKELES